MKCKQVHPKWEAKPSCIQINTDKEKEGPPPTVPEHVSARSAGLHASVLSAEVLDKQIEMCRSMVEINNSVSYK